MYVQVDIALDRTVEMELQEETYGIVPDFCTAELIVKEELPFIQGLFPAMYVDGNGVVQRGSVWLTRKHFEIMGDKRIDYVFDVVWHEN